MARFKITAPLNVPMMLLIPQYAMIKGANKKTFPSIENGILFFGSFRTFGGTERDINGVVAVEKTATIDTWYRPEIKSNCRIGIPKTGTVYEIIGDPENIEMRNQYMRIRVKAISGGA